MKKSENAATDGGKKKMKKSTKVWISVLSIVLVIAVVAVSLVFGWINDGRFATYTKSHIDKAVKAYAERQASDDPVRFVAHRGLSAEAYQNTAEAFRLAAAYDGVWAVETDVWVTSDGDFVCMHDGDALKGIKDVSKVPMATATSTPLEDAPNGELAPSLDEYLSIVIGGGKVALVELKDKNMTETAMDQLLDRISESTNGDFSQVRIISFHFRLLEYLRSKNDTVGLWYLYNVGPTKDVPGSNRKAKLNTLISLKMDVGINGMFITKSDVEAMHKAGREVNVWTINKARNAVLHAYEFHADIITSDFRMQDEIKKEYNL